MSLRCGIARGGAPTRWPSNVSVPHDLNEFVSPDPSPQAPGTETSKSVCARSCRPHVRMHSAGWLFMQFGAWFSGPSWSNCMTNTHTPMMPLQPLPISKFFLASPGLVPVLFTPTSQGAQLIGMATKMRAPVQRPPYHLRVPFSQLLRNTASASRGSPVA